MCVAREDSQAERLHVESVALGHIVSRASSGDGDCLSSLRKCGLGMDSSPVSTRAPSTASNLTANMVGEEEFVPTKSMSTRACKVTFEAGLACDDDAALYPFTLEVGEYVNEASFDYGMDQLRSALASVFTRVFTEQASEATPARDQDLFTSAGFQQEHPQASQPRRQRHSSNAVAALRRVPRVHDFSKLRG
eukprot:TRINITY_DN100896_c0_g1_i1.p1 TRINITY_DN100896_c0_g1~~TRINITY_DN100896_c0_g1_i1.p1  ORF type:complete len:192 (+),score=22.68 TRINITY_DN100896_c0_g1_i1:67-642(+)